jgi:hypothetical protein
MKLQERDYTKFLNEEEREAFELEEKIAHGTYVFQNTYRIK